ncbi:MAG: RNA polymerase sigma factor [Myxococcota bacterium]
MPARSQPDDARREPNRAIDADLAATYREHYAFVWRSLRRLGVPEDAVDDAVHDVFVVVARRLSEFEGRAAITSWLFAVAIRVAKHQRRSVARRQRRRDALARAVEVIAPSQSDAHTQHDAARTLHALLDRLDDEQRHVFILMELEQLTGREAAEILGIKPATAHSRLRIAREHLRRHAAELTGRDAPPKPALTRQRRSA